MKDWPTVAKSHDSRRAKTTAHGILRACLSSCISTTRDEERLIDGQRTGTARPFPLWRLPSGPYSPPIDHIREWYCPQARIANGLTFRPLFSSSPRRGFLLALSALSRSVARVPWRSGGIYGFNRSRGETGAFASDSDGSTLSTFDAGARRRRARRSGKQLIAMSSPGQEHHPR
jgi:hypothetical protein